jgi:hypothetical protein
MVGGNRSGVSGLGVKRQRTVNRAGTDGSVRRDLLWVCDEHLGRDASFRALRGYEGAWEALAADFG